MASGVVLCVSTHAVDLDDGRTLAPGESASAIDLTGDVVARQIEDGHLIVLDKAPTDSPRNPPPASKPTPPAEAIDLTGPGGKS